jgi:hypothetical protein
VASVVVIVLVLVLEGGAGDFEASITPHPSSARPTPTPKPTPAKPKKEKHRKPTPVRFHVVKLRAVPGRPRAKPPAVNKAAHRAAHRVTHLLNRLYTLAYTRAAGRKHAPPWLLGLFAGGAQRKARHHLEALTIGPAGPNLVVLRPAKAALWVRVLLDRHNRPVTAVAAANFKATGRVRGGGRLVAHSWATFFLQSGKKGWAISAFDAKHRILRQKG